MPTIDPKAPKFIIDGLAESLTSGDWTEDDMVQRAQIRLEKRLPKKRWNWIRPLARRLIERLGDRRPPAARVADFLTCDAGFRRALLQHQFCLSYREQPRPVMLPASGPPTTWDLPAIVTHGELANWLQVEPNDLDFLADVRNLETVRPHGALRHYRYHWHPKRSSGSARLIESPKFRLKRIQQKLLHGIFDLIPPHDAAHGFRRGRSITSSIEPHVGQQVVVRMDLRDYFPSIRQQRINGLLLAAGYPEQVARSICGLCTNAVPSDVWATFPNYADDQCRHESMYTRPHFPQGSPTSPAFANLCSFRLDKRLTGLANSMDAAYTRYADDLIFSGGSRLAKSTRHLQTQAYAIALEEGVEINLRKTRVMTQSVRQHALGVVINRRPNIRRKDFDKLKAILTNCARHGPEAQNHAGHPDFRSHLAGRVAHIATLNPPRGAKLASIFTEIDFSNA